ncbi:Phage tail protein [Vibrio crassostreae]|uniref:phage tail assembly chaperone n=1 Tax=Vibrio crassostreae TaxID=246167 RepID=UPI001B311076|nr:phage tail assembly chaperone [Vibrio crassostreae]CAK1801222.1 Phage tail protein [Vibrio crassostreae]CAK1814184.1 Phage tail protein [Vibrio crassostreae]CAK1817880.1 Phage tail protein [Vibrio crassostreae]CAK2287012.1 Phage tail protein [Vibrio crassostreae]CAK2287329.1 Phage tail protein [Vibrio crassostreae]
MEQIIQEFTDAELVRMTRWAEIREIRDAKLKVADNLLETAIDTGSDETVFRQYRQALRDIPQTYTNPEDVVWPQKPSSPQASV